MNNPKPILFSLCLLLFEMAFSQAGNKKYFSSLDSLRGSLGPDRTWWDVLHYDISVIPDFTGRSIQGKTTIQYKVLAGQQSDYMQIDLQQPLVIDSIFYDKKLYINYPSKPYYVKGNLLRLPLPKAQVNSIHSVSISYHGKPRQAINPPWDGGWIFKNDALGRPWMSVACQGLGASVWFPCKDHQSDEPDQGATLTIQIPDSLVAVGNGRLQRKNSENGLATYTWKVNNPINNYTIVPYIGKYVNWSDTLLGEKGKLDLNFWALDYDVVKAKKQFQQVKPMLRAFEFWFGPYPFYEDGYQLIQAPHLGMEHQSAIAYGNEFENGYRLGNTHIDLSESGWGKKWDFIIVHESAHEWFANNITTKDIADMWVHEGFTNYSETLFTEYYYGKVAANEYIQGLRKLIKNDMPVIGQYGVNKEGSGDMYAKGANMIHTIRQVIDNDILFRNILRGLNIDFYHQTVTSSQVERYISQKSGKNLSKVFNQYLRTNQIPQLVLKIDGNQLKIKWTNCIDGFDMPVKLATGQWIFPTTTEKKVKVANVKPAQVKVDSNFYITVRK